MHTFLIFGLMVGKSWETSFSLSRHIITTSTLTNMELVRGACEHCGPDGCMGYARSALRNYTLCDDCSHEKEAHIPLLYEKPDGAAKWRLRCHCAPEAPALPTVPATPFLSAKQHSRGEMLSHLQSSVLGKRKSESKQEEIKAARSSLFGSSRKDSSVSLATTTSRRASNPVMQQVLASKLKVGSVPYQNIPDLTEALKFDQCLRVDISDSSTSPFDLIRRDLDISLTCKLTFFAMNSNHELGEIPSKFTASDDAFRRYLLDHFCVLPTGIKARQIFSVLYVEPELLKCYVCLGEFEELTCQSGSGDIRHNVCATCGPQMRDRHWSTVCGVCKKSTTPMGDYLAEQGRRTHPDYSRLVVHDIE
jgi:hypothetical protein